MFSIHSNITRKFTKQAKNNFNFFSHPCTEEDNHLPHTRTDVQKRAFNRLLFLLRNGPAVSYHPPRFLFYIHTCAYELPYKRS